MCVLKLCLDLNLVIREGAYFSTYCTKAARCLGAELRYFDFDSCTAFVQSCLALVQHVESRFNTVEARLNTFPYRASIVEPLIDLRIEIVDFRF